MSLSALLKSSKPILVLLTVIYYLAVVLPHVTFGSFVNGFFEELDRAQYNLLVASVFTLFVVGLCLSAKRKIANHPDRAVITKFLVFSFALLVSCFVVLFVVYIEAIHFVQYAILAIFLFALFGNCKDTMSVAVFLGALDELYQYLVLDTMANYYDFNDVFFDTIGAGLGLLALKIIGVKTYLSRNKKWTERSEVWLLGMTIIAFLVLFLLGEFTVNPNESQPAFFTLFKIAPEGFWTIPKGPYAKFHILTPIPGMILILFTAYIYGTIDRVRPIVETE